MDFKCYICSDSFKSSNEAIDHLKKNHGIKENINLNILCIVNKPVHCGKSFKTFSGLRRHIPKCEEFKSMKNVETHQLKLCNSNNDHRVDFQNPAERVNDLSHSIEHEFNLNAVSYQQDNIYTEEAIEFNNGMKSEFVSANEEAAVTLNEFCADVISMNLSQKNTDAIFKLTERLVRNLQKFNVRLVNDESNHMSAVHVIDSTADFFAESLKNRNSVYKRDVTNKQKATFVCPKELSIGTRFERKCFTDRCGAGISIPQTVQNTYQLILPSETIQSLFRSKDFCHTYFTENTVLNHKCEKGKYKHFCCGEKYQKSEFFKKNPLAAQLHLSSDEFEITSPLQSKAGVHKICAIYLTIQNLPPKYLSKENNIYLVALCNANDLKSKTTDFNNLWQEIVRDIQYLETVGVEIDGQPNLKCTLTHLSFDNLGAHQALGYVESFSSNYYCRHCVLSKDQCQRTIEEDPLLLRTKTIYNEQLRIIENSEKVKYDETQGIKFYCKLNDLWEFHILDNPTADPMHDLAEGAVPFLMKQLYLYAFNKKVFTENDLNWMTQFNSYGKLYRREIPSQICLSKRSLGQNAAQSLCLFKHMPMILYGYRENEHLKAVWPCVISLLRILEIVYAYETTDRLLDILKMEIQKHLASIQNILNEHLRPKHHFMLHYPHIIRTMGPLIHLIMTRFEAKHQQIKRLLGDNRNFRNINKTLAWKHQRLASFTEFAYKDEIQTNKVTPVVSKFLDKIKMELDINEHVCETEYLRVNIYEYMPNLLFIYESCPYQIKKILLIKNDFVLFAKKCKVGAFNSFLNCFEIDLIESTNDAFIYINDLSNKKTFDLYNISGKNYIMSATIDLNKIDYWK